MFNRFIGTAKPAPVAEAPKPVDITNLQKHSDNMSKREQAEYKKLQDIDNKICEFGLLRFVNV